VQKQHEACPLPNGNIVLLDNGDKQRGWSRVLEVDPRTGGRVWAYKADPPQDFFCPARGTVQPLANGNVLVCDSYVGAAFEVTRKRRLVWRFLIPFYGKETGGRASMHMHRYELDYVDPILAAQGVMPPPSSASRPR
jgi:hypothetical protein